GIGTFCHEFSHVLGLPDVYDTDKEANGEASHPGAFDLMGSGNYNGENMCPPYYTFEERLRLGWVEEREICSISGDVELGTVDKNKALYIPTSQEGEYFILESRGGQKWDAALPVGVTVMHLDTSLRNVHGKTAKARYDAGDGINCFEDHPCYYPVPSMEGSQLREDLLFPGSHKVTSLLTSDWNGQETFYLSAISANAQGATLRLDFSTSYLYGKVTLPDGKAVEGALVSADPVQQSQSSPAPRILSPRGARFSAVTDSEGKYMIALEGCSHGDILEISASKDGYIPGVQTITVAPGRQEANLGMKLIIDFQETDLKKYASVSNTWSTWKFIENGNYDGLTTGIKFSADELSSEAGKIIRSASMFIDADSIGELLFKVQSGAETVLRKVLPDPQAGGWLSVDIEEEGLRIPSDQDVWFIFSFRNTSGLKIRLGLTDGREGGYLFCSGFDKEGKNLYSSPSSATYSFLTGVSLRSDGVIGEGVTVSDLGFNYIVPPSGVLSQGAEYIPSLAVSSSSKPTSVSWTLDGDPVPASGFILSSGRHILKDTMSFQDAHVETSEVVLPVQ
ncbi:MAG: immune inhibitor A, partial [Bacteroidales bacterium]|nr:immune inhibitor A [Bacteroidales bacterium]